MAKLPEPPPAGKLAARTPADLVVVTRATTFFRIYAAGGAHPQRWNGFRAFGPVPNARFDHHLPPDPAPHLRAARGPERAVLYLGLGLRTCVAEVFQDTRTVERQHPARWLVGFRLRREARLLDLTGTWPTRAGASQAINSGRRDRARAWARVVHEAYGDVEGLWYRSSMNAGEPAVVLNERSADALPDRPDLHLPLSHPGLDLALERTAAALGYLLA